MARGLDDGGLNLLLGVFALMLAIDTMPGETDLPKLLKAMSPVLDREEYVFCSVSADSRRDVGASPVMEFVEGEGVTLILTKSEAVREGLEFCYPCRRITLSIHSSLEAVGLLAKVTSHLASAGISVNVVSGFYHDHLFVPGDKGGIALALLLELSNATTAFSYNSLVPEFGVFNFQVSLKFYTETLPFKIEYARPEKRFAFLSLGSSQLMLEEVTGRMAASVEEFRAGQWRTESLDYPLGRGMSLSIAVDSIADLVKRLAEEKYPLKMEPREAWYRRGDLLIGERQILVMDPDGYLLRFQESLGVKSIIASDAN